MGYSTDFRKKVLEFLDKGRTMREAAEVSGIAPDTVNGWKQKLLKTGSLEDAPRRCVFRKLDPEKLRARVAAHPDACLAEIGEAFGCNGSAAAGPANGLGDFDSSRTGSRSSSGC